MDTLKTVVKKETLVKIIKSMTEINGFTVREGLELTGFLGSMMRI